jgi:hypothetical protein
VSAGSDLYRRLSTHDYGDEERRELMLQAWSDTPLMVDAHTGGWTNEWGRESEIHSWCVEQFGPPAHPFAGVPGKWQRGGATIHGWTWMGFATEEMMHKFIARWGDDD